MKNLIVANWKMNPVTQKEGKEIFDEIRDGVKGLKPEVVVCPPSVYLYASVFGGGIVSMGAQNVYFEDKGAFTGEISGLMLKDLGAEYVIIGHSERRKYFGETDEIVNKKIKKSLEVGLKVIFCIGETAEERDSGKKKEILERQIKIGLQRIGNLATAIAK
ncbi:MAG: triose-phosphate isomerase, partial [Candidatus Staskawiczbacteria bacterium]|nr:triose-phosphate isomerase [Candidatus Staskawiczbacteria bacterium]